MKFFNELLEDWHVRRMDKEDAYADNMHSEYPNYHTSVDALQRDDERKFNDNEAGMCKCPMCNCDPCECDKEEEEVDAYDRGWMDFYHSTERNPFQSGTPQFDQWEEGWEAAEHEFNKRLEAQHASDEGIRRMDNEEEEYGLGKYGQQGSHMGNLDTSIGTADEDEEEDDPYKLGYDAFLGGKDRKENPYHRGSAYYFIWNKGFNFAEDEAYHHEHNMQQLQHNYEEEETSPEDEVYDYAVFYDSSAFGGPEFIAGPFPSERAAYEWMIDNGYDERRDNNVFVDRMPEHYEEEEYDPSTDAYALGAEAYHNDQDLPDNPFPKGSEDYGLWRDGFYAAENLDLGRLKRQQFRRGHSYEEEEQDPTTTTATPQEQPVPSSTQQEPQREPTDDMANDKPGKPEDDDDENKLDTVADKATEDPDHQGLIRKVENAHLVYKRQTPDGTYDELWVYNVGNNMENELKIRKAILAGTDIPTNKTTSPDGGQEYEIWTAGNVEMLLIKGLPG